MKLEFEPFGDDLGIDESTLREYEDRKLEPVPTIAELLGQRHFFKQITEAIKLTRETGKEHCFLACLGEQGQIRINELLQGGEHRITTHTPAVVPDLGHPDGKGFHLPENHTPFFIFHVHSSKGINPSLQDLMYFHSVAEQNYNLSSQDDLFWVNPVFVIADTENQIAAYQYTPEVVIKLNEDTLIERAGDAVIEIGQDLGIKSWGGSDLVKSGFSGSRNFLLGEHQNGIVWGYPKFVTDKPETIAKICQAVELKTVSVNKYTKPNLLKAVEQFKISQKWEE